MEHGNGFMSEVPMRGERDDIREKMKDHWAKTGSLDIEGVPDEMKHEFVREHLEATRHEVEQMVGRLAELKAQQADWERLAEQVGLDGASDGKGSDGAAAEGPEKR